MDRALLIKLLLLIGFILLVVASLGLGGVFFSLSASVGLAIGFGGLASWCLSAVCATL